MAEFMLRLEKLNSWVKTFSPEQVHIGKLAFFPKLAQVNLGKKSMVLRRRESQILRCLCVHSNQVLTRRQIARWAWEAHEPLPTNKSIDTYIKRLRRILGPEAERVQTVRGYGYRLLLTER